MKCQALYSLKLKKGITKFVICYHIMLQTIIFTLCPALLGQFNAILPSMIMITIHKYRYAVLKVMTGGMTDNPNPI